MSQALPSSATAAPKSAGQRSARQKRLAIRSWRRGMREMDLILGSWADAHLDRLTPAELTRFEALLSCNDPDLYAWICGRAPAPAEHRELIAILRDSDTAHRFISS